MLIESIDSYHRKLLIASCQTQWDRFSSELIDTPLHDYIMEGVIYEEAYRASPGGIKIQPGFLSHLTY